MRRIDKMGGTLRAIETGLSSSAKSRTRPTNTRRAVESGERVVVGVNRFQKEESASPPTFRLDPALEQAQVESLRQVRAVTKPSPPWRRNWRARAGGARSGQSDAANPGRGRCIRHGRRDVGRTARGVFGEYREM